MQEKYINIKSPFILSVNVFQNLYSYRYNKITYKDT